METKIKKVLAKIKPFLQSDGGDVEFIKYEKGIVYVKLLGACQHCPYADATLEMMIEKALTDEIKEVIKVVNLNND